MKKQNKIILLILTLLPLIIIPVMVFWIIGGALQMENAVNPEASVPTFVTGIVIFALLISIVSLGTWVYYLVHVVQNKNLDSNERLMWVLLFIFVSFISHIIYFFMRIWDAPEPEEGLKKY